MEAALQPWSTNLLNSEYVSVQDLFQVWAQRWYRAVGMLRNSPWPCVWFKSANVPESSSSSQGFNLKRWPVLANETASQVFLDCLFISSLYSLLYFYKNISPEVWHFQFPLSQIYCLHKSLLLFKQSSCFRDSLGISLIIYYLPPLMCPIVNLWLHCKSCYNPSVYYLSS